MKRLIIVAPCLVALLALSGVSAGGALAGNYYACTQMKKGEYTEGECKTKARKAEEGHVRNSSDGSQVCPTEER